MTFGNRFSEYRSSSKKGRTWIAAWTLALAPDIFSEHLSMSLSYSRQHATPWYAEKKRHARVSGLRVLHWCQCGKLARFCFCCLDINSVLPVCSRKLANRGMLLFPFALPIGGLLVQPFRFPWMAVLPERRCSKTLDMRELLHYQNWHWSRCSATTNEEVPSSSANWGLKNDLQNVVLCPLTLKHIQLLSGYKIDLGRRGNIRKRINV
jgi:hypothetical protein